MRIAVLADFHLGYPKFEEDSFKQAEEAFGKACEEADLIVLLGDIFDARTPKQEILARSFEIFRKAFERKWGVKLVEYVSREGRRNYTRIPVVAIHGTHERRTRGLVNPIELLEKAGFVVNVHSAVAVFEKNGERVALQGMGGVPEEYAREALEVVSPKPVEDAFNVFIFHQSMKEFLPGEEFIGAEDLPKGFDLYLCGHMHTRKIEKVGGALLIIPGSTVVTQMRKEDAEEKGFFIFDTEKKDAEFYKIKTRPFFYEELEFEEAKLEEVVKKMRERVEKILEKSSEMPVVKIKIKGSLAKGLDPSNLQLGEVIKEFEGKAVVEVDKEMESHEFKERVEKIRGLREGKLSVREMGMEILKRKLKEYGVVDFDVEGLYTILSENKKDAPQKALRRILE
ncbi:MAG: DNA repair exonuclease [Candidatus Micrarchaeia archaeon]